MSRDVVKPSPSCPYDPRPQGDKTRLGSCDELYLHIDKGPPILRGARTQRGLPYFSPYRGHRDATVLYSRVSYKNQEWRTTPECLEASSEPRSGCYDGEG